MKESRKRIIEQQENELAKKKKRSLIKAELLSRALTFTVKIPNVLLEEISASLHAVQHADETEVHEVVTFDQSTQTYLPSVPRATQMLRHKQKTLSTCL